MHPGLFVFLAFGSYAVASFSHFTWRQGVRQKWTNEVSNDTSGKPFPCTPRPYDMEDYFYRDAEHDWSRKNGHRERMKEIQAIDQAYLDQLHRESATREARTGWQKFKDGFKL